MVDRRDLAVGVGRSATETPQQMQENEIQIEDAPR